MELSDLQNLKLSKLQMLAITIYYECILINPEMQTQYIKEEPRFPTEQIFWDTLKDTGIELPKLVQ